MKFLRTASTGRLLALIGGLVIAIAGGTAIAVAATSNGPVPKAKPLAQSIHDALAAKPVKGITADITFTNNLISSDDLPGETADPLLQGTRHGRVWLSDDGRLRIELQGDNGDANLVVSKTSFWVSDPMQNTVYEGTLPADKANAAGAKAKTAHRIPTVAQIQSRLTRLMGRVDVGGVQTSSPGDVAGRGAYSVAVSPKHSGGLLGQAQLAWDAVTGVPLRVAIYARGNPTPVLALSATNISYGTDLRLRPQHPAARRRQGRQGLQRRRARLRRADRPHGAGQGQRTPGSRVSRRSPGTCPSPSARLRRWRGCPVRTSPC